MTTQYETPSQTGNNTGIIILAILIIAAIAVAAAIYMTSGSSTNTTNTTVERFSSTVERIPAPDVNPQPAPSPAQDQPVVSNPAPAETPQPVQ